MVNLDYPTTTTQLVHGQRTDQGRQPPHHTAQLVAITDSLIKSDSLKQKQTH